MKKKKEIQVKKPEKTTNKYEKILKVKDEYLLNGTYPIEITSLGTIEL